MSTAKKSTNIKYPYKQNITSNYKIIEQLPKTPAHRPLLKPSLASILHPPPVIILFCWFGIPCYLKWILDSYTYGLSDKSETSTGIFHYQNYEINIHLVNDITLTSRDGIFIWSSNALLNSFG